MFHIYSGQDFETVGAQIGTKLSHRLFGKSSDIVPAVGDKTRAWSVHRRDPDVLIRVAGLLAVGRADPCLTPPSGVARKRAEQCSQRESSLAGARGGGLGGLIFLCNL